jgi:hypothetical protein
MIDSIVGTILNYLISVAGIVSVLLLTALIWQTIQLEKERSARDDDHRIDNERADKRLLAFDTLAASISALSTNLARIEGYILAMKREQ